MHQQHHSQVSDEFEVTIGEEKKILKAGDSFYILSNVMHEAI